MRSSMCIAEACRSVGRRSPCSGWRLLNNDAGSDGIVLTASAGTRALVIAGKPLGEPIAQYGPFVMNTKDEIHEAMQDYQAGKFAAAG